MTARRDGLKLLRHEEKGKVAAQEAEVGGKGVDWAEVPDPLDEEGRREWRRLAWVFKGQPTRFREGDRAALAAYCTYWSAFFRASRDVADRGVLAEGRSTHDRERLVKNPASVTMREASTQLRYWARELGLTPDARGRIGIRDDRVEPHVDRDNPFAG